MLALYFGRIRHLSSLAGRGGSSRTCGPAGRGARRPSGATTRSGGSPTSTPTASNLLYLGRQYLYPAALEGALKLKEISYIHAEGYPAAEMKHGPIALVDEDTPSVFLVPRGSVFDKVMSNMQEIKARGGPVIADRQRGRPAEVAGGGPTT